ncbi:hypothetical protein BU26DRAFT_519123 [Trematosphaeria pertusa]|uniref:Uncharacterized protein n=1 Tax=Trematosphaeria pertusa TaxID=390896 RepID=A0A6A6IEW4_9PLEO|nr:uncharacterized protein BU26DRAFT_519123 [Trematosphaeria pertusa]KAF2248946.1 hypothetical protein BU26DRAFT_519123 [Trematosphaeria pertusa]
MSYNLSVIVYGPGDDPNHRSHWAFAFHAPGSSVGNILHVTLLDLNKLVYAFEKRKGVEVQSKSSEGYFTIATLSLEQYQRADRIISQEPAPNNGKDRCQDWVQNCIIALEVEEIVPPGTSEWLGGLVAQPAATVASKTGSRWVRTVR